MDIIFDTFRATSHVIANQPVYSVLGCVVLSVGMLRLYCRLTVGMCNSDQSMTGRTVLITGANSGIGKETATDLARRNARVIMACRNTAEAERVAGEIISCTGNKNVIVKHLDLASLKSVRKCAEDVLNTEDKLHVLINNAGIPDCDEVTEDGYDAVLQSNHLGHFLLTLLLLDLLKKSAPSRIINVSSLAYKMGKLDLEDMEGKKCNSLVGKYARSKYANILFTIELAARLENSGVTVNALHPGAVKTNIVHKKKITLFRRFIRLLIWITGKSPEEGAQTTIYLAVHPEVEKVTGKYFSDCKEEKILATQLNKALAKQFFEVSEKMVGLDVKYL